jgi:thiol:disulfide interchange protein
VVGFFDPAGPLSEPVTLESSFTPATNERPAMLVLTARVALGKHIYSVSQPPGGPRPTRIELAQSKDYRLLGTFAAHPQPTKRVEEGPVWAGLEIQEHEGEVTWYAPIEFTAGVDPAKLKINGSVHMEACETSGYCEPVRKEFTAALAQNATVALPDVAANPQSAIRNPQSPTIGSYQARGSVVKITGRLQPATVRPGESAQLVITATTPSGWHVYAHSPRDDKAGSKPTLIAFGSTSGLVPYGPTTEAPVKVDNSIPQFGPMRYHEGEVTWTARIDVPQNAPPGAYEINGVVGYQACEKRADGMGSCELMHAARFAGTLEVASAVGGSESAPLTFTQAPYRDAAATAAVFANYLDGQSTTQPQQHSTAPAPTDENSDSNSQDAHAIAVEAARESVPVLKASDSYDLGRLNVDAGGGALAYYIALAFAGGLILNLMPCVLPVISLKVMSFVEQAGRSRAHALVLNIWYAAGIVSVFLLLGVLAALPQLGLSERGLGWGGQFGNTAFNVTIAAVVFAMALSLLGVWEVPIPGFFGSGAVQSAAAKEGPLGAFLKGVVTTVLATPCTAPFMATAIAWAVTQPATTTLIVFSSLGLGMASPYLLVGVYPELLRFLPKPGVWMETFKQITGFVLLATVVFILSFMEPAAVVPTVTLLMGVGVACWLIARTPYTAEWRDRMQSWASAGLVLLVFVAVSFGWLYDDVMRPRFANSQSAPAVAAGGKWQPFSLEKLKQVVVDEGRTVLVDFSADWCFNCKVLEQAVLHTSEIEQAIDQAEAVTMYADYTDYPPEIERTIHALKASGVPVIAVFPGNAPYQPIVFRGGYTKQGLIEALEKATGRRLRVESGAIAAAAPMN